MLAKTPRGKVRPSRKREVRPSRTGTGPDFEVSYDIPFDATTSGAATGATSSDADKTDGIPNHMLRTSNYMYTTLHM